MFCNVMFIGGYMGIYVEKIGFYCFFMYYVYFLNVFKVLKDFGNEIL